MSVRVHPQKGEDWQDLAELRVLIVDDDPDIRTLAGLALATDPMIEPRVAASGQEALAILQKWRPDCVLLDSRMPQMRGEMLILALQVSDTAAGIPVIMFSASATFDDAVRYAGLGAAGLISKPFDPATLAHEVRSVLAKKASMVSPVEP